MPKDDRVYEVARSPYGRGYDVFCSVRAIFGGASDIVYAKFDMPYHNAIALRNKLNGHTRKPR